MAVPALAKGFFISLDGSVLQSAKSASGLEGEGGMKAFFGEMERQELNHLGTSLQTSIITSPAGFIPWKKTTWQITASTAQVFVVTGLYISIEKHNADKIRNEQVKKVLDATYFTPASDDDKLKAIDQNYIKSTGTHLSNDQLQRMANML